MHAVDIEEVREDEVAQRRFAPDVLQRRKQALERIREKTLGAFLEMRLMHVAHQGNRERDPPERRDGEGELHGRRR